METLKENLFKLQLVMTVFLCKAGCGYIQCGAQVEALRAHLNNSSWASVSRDLLTLDPNNFPFQHLPP